MSDPSRPPYPPPNGSAPPPGHWSAPPAAPPSYPPQAYSPPYGGAPAPVPPPSRRGGQGAVYVLIAVVAIGIVAAAAFLLRPDKAPSRPDSDGPLKSVSGQSFPREFGDGFVRDDTGFATEYGRAYVDKDGNRFAILLNVENETLEEQARYYNPDLIRRLDDDVYCFDVPVGSDPTQCQMQLADGTIMIQAPEPWPGEELVEILREFYAELE